MESLAYVYLVLAVDSPSQVKLFSGINRYKLSSQVYVHFLSLGVLLSMFLLAHSANALQLQLRDQGSTVKQVQSRLKALGYFSASTTGYFGKVTETSVKQFQRANGLYPDGIVGPQTWNALMRGTPSGEFNTNYQNNLALGSRGESVSQLQQGLAQLGYLGVSNVTGFFDYRTRTAVQQFQADYRLRTDGVVDRATFVAITTNLTEVYPPISQPNNPGQSSQNLSLGDTGSRVESVQTRLKGWGYFTANITGYFGPVTETAVKKFQRDRGLPITGIVDRKTLAVLNGEITSISHNPIPIQSQHTGMTLRRGNQGLYVRQLQQQLQRLNYYPGSINGIFGPETEYAVFRFQQDYYLSPTGVASPDTLSTLQMMVNPLS